MSPNRPHILYSLLFPSKKTHRFGKNWHLCNMWCFHPGLRHFVHLFIFRSAQLFNTHSARPAWQKRPFSSRVSPGHFSFVFPAVLKDSILARFSPYILQLLFHAYSLFSSIFFQTLYWILLLIWKVVQLILFDRSWPYYVQMMINCFPF